ncbi:MAG: AraC family transcriptional regulator [Lachnospiraceae bacterium]|nr:AraC family transcriptional regulator [Lachnospiraceae bacterium]
MNDFNLLHEANRYEDTAFPYEMYCVNKYGISPAGRGYRDMHWHEELQFTLVTNGTMQMQVNGQDYRLAENEAIFINSGFLHMTTELSEEGEYVSFNFPAKLLSFFGGSRMEQDYVLPYTTNLALPVTILRQDVQWQKQVVDLLWQLKDAVRNGEMFGREYFLSVKTVEIWYILIRELSKKAIRQSDSFICKKKRMQAMLTFIHENYAEKIAVEDIAAAANISDGECHRCFKSLLHATPKEYLNTYRLNKALELLAETELPVTAIASQCGYNFTSHFISSFKAKYGESPAKYRAKRLKDR